jgi:hypothetical protein
VPYPSPFDALEAAFRSLGEPPRPLRIDCGVVSDVLPRTSGSPLEVRSLLLHPSTDYETRDATLGRLVGRAQAERGRWLVATMGMVLPGLRARTTALARCCAVFDEAVADMEAEALSGLVHTVLGVEPDRRKLAATLVWGGHGSARRFVDRQVAERKRCRPGHHPAHLAVPRHADLVLAAAMSAGVLDRREASLIGDTRLDGARVVQLARSEGTPAWQIRRQRRTAELRLAAWLDDRCDV